MSSSDPSRRRFLHLVARTGAAAGIAALGAGCGGEIIPAGNIADLPEGTLRAVGQTWVAIGRDEDGVYAMKLICTHAQCNIAEQGPIDPAGIRCDCHGSQFDRNGYVTKGPAEQPLEHCKVDIDADGNITVDTGVTVDPEARTPVATA